MKRLIITAIFCGMLGGVYAQQAKTDSIKSTTDTIVRMKNKHPRTNTNLVIRIGNDEGSHIRITTDTTKADTAWDKKMKRMHKNADKASNNHEAKESRPGFSIGLTVFSDFYLGFATLIDNGSFTLSSKNNFLEYNQAKTSNVGFNFFKFGYRFNDNFKITLNGAFDWTLIRLHDNIDIVPDVPTLQAVANTTNHYSKNRFSSNYLQLPLSFDFRTHKDKNNNRFDFTVGPEVGFLIDGMQKQISPEHGKTKNFNDFHFSRFEYGTFTKISYGGLGIYAKYWFNDMFENSPNQQGLKSFSFGLTFGI